VLACYHHCLSEANELSFVAVALNCVYCIPRKVHPTLSNVRSSLLSDPLHSRSKRTLTFCVQEARAELEKFVLCSPAFGEMASDQFGSGGGFSFIVERTNATWQTDVVAAYIATAPNLPPNTTWNVNGRGTPDARALSSPFVRVLFLVVCALVRRRCGFARSGVVRCGVVLCSVV
jgi:hypothetical protein